MTAESLIRIFEHALASERIGHSQCTAMDEAAFQILYRKTAPSLFSYIKMAVRDAPLAEDILQETFCRFLCANLSELNEFQVKSYLYKTAMSQVYDHWRQQKRERTWREIAIAPSEQSLQVDPGNDFVALFRTLKPKHQTLLWLAYVEGFTHREIAHAMDIKEPSVRVLLIRARRRLATILRKRGIA
jgi:RNA polymerase sigma-70 factor, ECF subfamily